VTEASLSKAPSGRSALPRWAHIVVASAVTVVAMAASLLMKWQCVSPLKDEHGTSLIDRSHALLYACVTDVQGFWPARELYLHLLPYVNGQYVPPAAIGGGVIEYPILSGLLIWASALPVADDGAFLVVSAIVLTPFAVATTILLVLLAPRRAWLWYLAPALVLYGVYNWDLPAVAVTTAACFVLIRRPWSTRVMFLSVGVLLGVGGALKLYPLMFMLPMLLFALFGMDRWRRPDRSSVIDALALIAGAAVVTIAVNVPFLLADPEGWAIPYLFQAARPIDGSTLSFWYNLFRRFGDPMSVGSQLWMARLSTVATLLGLVGVAAAGLVLMRRVGAYPWLQVSASMLCAYMVLNKVNSPQYILWLLPFLVILSVRVWLIVVYATCDVVLFLTFFWDAYLGGIGVTERWTEIVFHGAIWLRIGLLFVLVVVLLRSEPVRAVRRDSVRVETA